jgi:hypothetical protein
MKTSLTILMLLATLSIYSQKNSDVVVLKIQQNYDLSNVDSYIRISYPDENTKTLPLTKAGYRSDDAKEDANTKIIQKAINELVKEGYKIVSSDISGDFHLTRTLMIFERKKE